MLLIKKLHLKKNALTLTLLTNDKNHPWSGPRWIVGAKVSRMTHAVVRSDDEQHLMVNVRVEKDVVLSK